MCVANLFTSFDRLGLFTARDNNKVTLGFKITS